MNNQKNASVIHALKGLCHFKLHNVEVACLLFFLLFFSQASFSQCQVAAGGGVDGRTCTAATIGGGAGEYRTMNTTAGVYYDLELTTGNSQATGICINGGGRITGAYTHLAAGASITVGPYRDNGSWAGAASSAVVTYKETTPVSTNSSTTTICNGTNTTLSGNNAVAAQKGTGAWSVVSGPNPGAGQFTSTTTYNTTFTPAGGPGAYVVRWTVSNGTCTPATSDATITVTGTPTTQTTAFTATNITATTMTLGWTVGNGSSRLIIARSGSAPTDPTTGTAYAANVAYGSGAAVGSGYSVYNSTGKAVNITGLTAGTTYDFDAYEYNGTGCYNLTKLTGNFCTQPATPGFITGVVSQEPAATGQTYSIAAVTGATAYTWTVPAGWSITSGAGTNSITVTVGSNGQDGNITVTADNSCGSSAAQILGVAASNPPTPADITGTTTVGVCNTTALAVPVPTGGTESTSGGFRIHKFTADGDFIVPAGFSGDVEVLIVAGGGSGGPAIGGGGGGGGVVHIPAVAVTGATYSQVVGAGGAISSTTVGNSGVASTGFGATAAGGGTSGRHDAANGTDGGSSGGAASNNGVLNISGSATGSSLGANTGNIFGNTGGDMQAPRLAGPTRAAGGGGAGGVGLNTNSNSMGTGHGAGGPGIGNSILGTLYYWGGGGGGGSHYNTNSGDGGIGGGGGGGDSDPGATAGSGGGSALNSGSAGNIGGDVNGGAGGANTGGGGGGGTWSNGLGGAGGSGIVVVSYPVMTGGTWSSSNTAIATVDASGVVTGVSDGTVTITYTVTKGSTTSETNTVVTVTEPTQATSFSATNITATTMTLGWTRGTGTGGVLVIAREGSAPTDPTAGITYAANVAYGSGTAVGSGYSVYSSTGRAVNITGLTAGTTYHFAAYEYNGTGCYNLTQLTGNFCTQPATPGFITGVVSQEPAATGQTYSIDAVTGATGYTWTVPAGWSITSGAGTNSITVTVGSNGQDGNITVTADNACGSSAAQILGVAASNPPTPADITGTTTVAVCNTTALAVPVPTGGTESTSGGFRIHKFTADGDFTVPAGFSGDVEVLIVAGGGSGGPSIGGGGGGGGVIHIPAVAATEGTYSQVVGAGGVASGTTVGVSGSNSTGFGATAAGGGGGGRYHITNGLNGGSSGGAGANAAGGSYNISGNATGSSLGGNSGNIFGNTGGDLHAVRLGTPTRSAGGGGAGGPALNTDPTSMGTGHGAGGPGIGNAILGTLYYWGGGGGAGSYYNTGAGDGGLGGSGGGGETNAGPAGVAGASGLNAGSAGSIGGNVNGGAAGANTGSGGGGGTWSTGLGGNGGSGIVVVSYPVMTGGTWSSSNTAIATVDASGVVTGVSSGTVTITYTVTKGSTTSETNTVVTVTGATQATTFTYGSITSTTMTLGWTRGTGTGGILVIAREGSAPTDPTRGVAYTGNAAYGSGDAVGGGFAAYVGTGTSVALTGLTVGATYYFSGYEFDTGECYNLTELTGTSCALPDQPSTMNSD